MIDDTVTIALIASAFPTIGVIGTAYFQYKASKKADGKLDHITYLTNSSATKAVDKIASLEKTIQNLVREK